MSMPPLVLSSDSHVFEPPDLWQTRIDAAFRDRAPRIERIDGADQIVVERDQILSGIGLISNAGMRFEAPETISAQGRFEDVHRGGYDPQQHLKDMALDGVADVGLGLSASESTFPNRARSWRRSRRACRTTNRPRSPAATPPTYTILTWRR